LLKHAPVVPKITEGPFGTRGLWQRVWLVGHHVDDKRPECGLWAIMWMTKAPSVACGPSCG